MPKATILQLDASDNVAVALEDLARGTAVSDCLQAREQIPFAHKMAIRPIDAGAAVVKYGVPIAFATRPIEAGEWVHGHNSKSYFVAEKEAQSQ